MLVCAANALRPSAISATSKLVPPTSPVITSGNPAVWATCAAAITPAAGPDSAVFTGRRRAVSTDITPPFDCTNRNAPSKPADVIPASSRPRYPATSGWR